MTTSDASDWALKPRIGIGGLRFGSSLAIAQLQERYGPVQGTRDESGQLGDSDAAMALRQLGFSEADIEAALSARQSPPAAQANSKTAAFESGLVMEFSGDKLTEILADDHAKLLHIEGQPIFSEEPRTVITRMATILGERPIIHREEVVFPDNFIFLFQFLRQGSPSRGTVTTGNAAERSIIWRASPRTGGEDLSKYVPLEL